MLHQTQGKAEYLGNLVQVKCAQAFGENIEKYWKVRPINLYNRE